LEATWGNVSRRAEEEIAIAAYRESALSLGQVAQLLGLSVLQAETFLAQRGVEIPYTPEELEQDSASLRNSLVLK
jgi:predicted HTH domain antitoxin